MTRNSLRLLFLKKTAAFGFVILVAVVLMAILAPVIAPYNPYTVSPQALQAPSSTHLMGTDNLGRDIFSMILWGARPILFVAALATATSALLGIVVGAVSGYFGGKVDDILMRVTEFFMVIPRFFLALVVVALWGPKLTTIALIIGVLSWPATARIARSEFLQLREQNFVTAALMAGESTPRTIFSEVLPNALPAVVTNIALGVADAILTYTGFSFLGFGDPNQISWGDLLNEAQPYLINAWWIAVFPGIAVLLVVLAAVFLGDSFNEILNPRIHSELRKK